MQQSIVERIGFAPKCEQILSLHHGDSIWLRIRTYYVFRPTEAIPTDVLNAFIDSQAYRDDMVGPGFKLNTDRDVHGPFRASYITREHYQQISHERLKKLLDERIRTPFWKGQESPTMPVRERVKMERALSDVKHFAIHQFTLNHAIDGSTSPELHAPSGTPAHPKHDFSDILWAYQEYIAIPEAEDATRRKGMYTFTVGYD